MHCREQPGVAAWKQRWGWAGSAAATLASKQGFSTASGTRSTLCSVKQEDPRKANRAALAAKRNYSWARRPEQQLPAAPRVRAALAGLRTSCPRPPPAPGCPPSPPGWGASGGWAGPAWFAAGLGGGFGGRPRAGAAPLSPAGPRGAARPPEPRLQQVRAGRGGACCESRAKQSRAQHHTAQHSTTQHSTAWLGFHPPGPGSLRGGRTVPPGASARRGS